MAWEAQKVWKLESMSGYSFEREFNGAIFFRCRQHPSIGYIWKIIDISYLRLIKIISGIHVIDFNLIVDNLSTIL